MTLEDHLTALNACPDAREWARDYPTLRAAWGACERADWLLWYAARSGTDRKLLVRAACACARTALPHVPPDEDRPLRAIEVAERWASGDPVVTSKELHASAHAVRAAVASAHTSHAAHAAHAAAAVGADAVACVTIDAVTYAFAYAVSDAAHSAANASADAAAASCISPASGGAAAATAARLHAHRTMCDIVRALIPCPEEP